MSTKTTKKTPTAAAPTGFALLALWVRAGLVLAGIAWALGLQTAWWQRALMAAAGLGLALLDTSGTATMSGPRELLAAVLDQLSWIRVPLAVAGGAWLIDVLMLPAPGRVALAAAVVAVALMERVGPAQAAVAGGTR
jgi:hypothetical protein